MRKPYMSCSLHLHDAPIEVDLIPANATHGDAFVTIHIAGMSILVFTEKQAERIVNAGIRAQLLFQEPGEETDKTEAPAEELIHA